MENMHHSDPKAKENPQAAEDPWRVQDWRFSGDGTSEEKLRFLLNYAILAPSGHNTQPWLFTIKDKALTLYADRTRALTVVDPEDRELVMSCGAALFPSARGDATFWIRACRAPPARRPCS
jgi:hypothetical protein